MRNLFALIAVAALTANPLCGQEKPEPSSGILGQARALAQDRQLEKANELLAGFLQRNPGDEAALQELGEVHYLVGSTIVILFRSIRFRIKESHKPLVEIRLPNHFRAWQGTNPGDQRMCVLAASFDQLLPRPSGLIGAGSIVGKPLALRDHSGFQSIWSRASAAWVR